MWFIRRRDKSKDESENALKEAVQASKEIKERGHEVTAISEGLKEFRERNHFAEQLEELIMRRRGGYSQ